MSQFTGTTDDKHDDIVSAISLLVETFAPYADMGAKTGAIDAAYASNAQEFEMHQMVHGIGKYAEKNPGFAGDDNPATAYQLGQAVQGFESSGETDPLSDLFGGDRALKGGF
jgi:hypothetical protein